MTAHALERLAERFPKYPAAKVLQMIEDAYRLGSLEHIADSVQAGVAVYRLKAGSLVCYPVITGAADVKTVLTEGMDFETPTGRIALGEAKRAEGQRGRVINEYLVQGSDEWLAARCGLITASEMKLLLTPTLKLANNEKTRSHIYELLAQRITGHVEPHYISDDMLRGIDDETEARMLYTKHHAPVREVGFVTNDKWGFTLGYSPDGLIGPEVAPIGGIECKSRRQKYQVQTIIENVIGETVPADYLLQHQTGMLVAELSWLDFISYSGGLPMAVIRIYPDDKVQDAILDAASEAEAQMITLRRDYDRAAANLIPTKRRIEQEIF